MLNEHLKELDWRVGFEMLDGLPLLHVGIAIGAGLALHNGACILVSLYQVASLKQGISASENR